MSWFEQPLPVCTFVNNFVHYGGQIRVAQHKIYREDGRRICVIIEVTKIHLERLSRTSVYEREMKVDRVYDADNHHQIPSFDIEVAA